MIVTRNSFLSSAILLSAIACASTAHAATAVRDSARADSVLLLPEVAVERERPLSEVRKRRPTAFVSEIRTRTSGKAIETLGSLLSTAPGVHVVQYGGLGSFSTVSLRGAPAGQVAVYLDGVPMHSASQTVVDLSTLPSTSVEVVEVYRGGSPLMLGSARGGGAVNLVTGHGAGDPEMTLARGSFGTWEARGTGGFTLGAWSGWMHGGFQRSDGNFSYFDDNGTPVNLSDDTMTERTNNRFESGSGLGRLAWRPNDAWQVSARAQAYRSAQGFAGLGATPSDNAHRELRRWVTQADVTRSVGDGGAAVLDAALTRERSRFNDALGELGVGRHDTDDQLASEQATLRLQTPRLPLGLSLQTALSRRAERADLHDAADGRPDPPQSVRDSRGLTIEGRVAPVERLQLVAAQRWDRIEDHLRSSGIVGRIDARDVRRDVRSPQLGARLLLALGLEARANWSRAERVPDFTELFGNQGAVAGNPALSPERVESRDVGMAWHGRRGAWDASAEWAHFASDAEDMIVYARNSPSSSKAQNISRARIRGDEVSLRVAMPRGFSVSGSATWQSAIDAGDVAAWAGKRLPQRPSMEAYARVAWQGGPLRLAGDAQYMSDNYLDRYNTYRVSSRTLVGAAIGYALAAGRMQLSLEGKNLGNNQIADIAGYPLPGRSFYAALGWRPGPAGPDAR